VSFLDLLEVWPREAIVDDSPEASETRCPNCYKKRFQCGRCGYQDQVINTKQQLIHHLGMKRHKHFILVKHPNKRMFEFAYAIIEQEPGGFVHASISSKELLHEINIELVTKLFSNSWILVTGCTIDDILKISQISKAYKTGHTIIFMTYERPTEEMHETYRVLIADGTKTEKSK
jgi:hypothetical protein